MLDKFKFFNFKDKSKIKSSFLKSVFKQSIISIGSICSSSDRDSRASDRQSFASARSSSFIDFGICGSSIFLNDFGSFKFFFKIKFFSKGGFGGRDKGGSIFIVEDVLVKYRGSFFFILSLYSSILFTSNKKSSVKSDKYDKVGQKSSKIGSLILKISFFLGGKFKLLFFVLLSGILIFLSSILKLFFFGSKLMKSSREDLKSSKDERSRLRDLNLSGSV